MCHCYFGASVCLARSSKQTSCVPGPRRCDAGRGGAGQRGARGHSEVPSLCTLVQPPASSSPLWPLSPLRPLSVRPGLPLEEVPEGGLGTRLTAIGMLGRMGITGLANPPWPGCSWPPSGLTPTSSVRPGFPPEEAPCGPSWSAPSRQPLEQWRAVKARLPSDGRRSLQLPSPT